MWFLDGLDAILPTQNVLLEISGGQIGTTEQLWKKSSVWCALHPTRSDCDLATRILHWRKCTETIIGFRRVGHGSVRYGGRPNGISSAAREAPVHVNETLFGDGFAALAT